MAYNLTDSQKELLRAIVRAVRGGDIEEEFVIAWADDGPIINEAVQDKLSFLDNLTGGKLDALVRAGLIHTSQRDYFTSVNLLGNAYDAVDRDFDSPDTSFIQYLTPLADTTNLDSELNKRVVKLLPAGPSDRTVWDSAVRTSAVILEERLRDVGKIPDPNAHGQGLVSQVFSKTGPLSGKFTVDAERQSYRDLYAGVVGLVRNPSAHRLIDPTPEEGGVLIVLVNLLLTKLEALR